MKDSTVSLLKHWIEPAHPGIVRLHEDLMAIYRAIREHSQKEIDAIFDKLARSIGFVVTTSVPVEFEIKDGTIHNPRMGAEHLKGTMFEEVLNPIREMKTLPGAAGTYNIYILWFDALRLKLRTDWMEPAHFLSDRVISAMQGQIFQKIQRHIPEPVHWFDPGIAISELDAIQIVAIDTIYPELQLSKQIAAYRERFRATVTPGVREPAHFHVNPGTQPKAE